MKLGRSWRAGVTLAVLAATLPACSGRRQAEVNAIVPKFEVNRSRAPLGSAIEVTYTWQVEPTAKKLTQDYRAFVHFVDSHGVMLFDDDHAPIPSAATWEPGKTYSYTRTVFIPIYPYVGDVDVRIGLHPLNKGERLALKAEDVGLREYKVAQMELLPQTENIFPVYKDGWHNPESSAHNPRLERTWTKKDALISFKNPKKDILIYLEADTNSKAFDAPPVLTVAVAGKAGLVIPIDNSEVFLKKIKVKAADLGTQEWVDLRLSMNQSFVPKLRGVNTADDRELGLMVYHLWVGEADKLGAPTAVVDAVPVTLPSPAATAAASPAPGKAPAAVTTAPASTKGAPAPAAVKKTPAPAKSPTAATKQ